MSQIYTSLEVDLSNGVIPITKATADLAGLIKQLKATNRPFLVTQNGYPTAAIMSVSLFQEMRDLIRQQQERIDDLEEKVSSH